MYQISNLDYSKIGDKLFGPNTNGWKFVCPMCGYEQSRRSIKELSDMVDTTWVHNACAGRFIKNVGCNYISGGLIKLAPIKIYYSDYTSSSVFMFAHKRAESEIAKAAKKFKPPVYPETDIMLWSEYTWPKWVPQQIREHIEKFHFSDWGRGPKTWLEGAKQNHLPPLGATVTMREICSDNWVTGRFVPAWNNMGRVVRPDGTYVVV